MSAIVAVGAACTGRPASSAAPSADSVRAEVTAALDRYMVAARPVDPDGTAAAWLAFPGQPLSEQHGRFVIEWVRPTVGGWLIHRYYRNLLPPAR